MSNDLTRYLGRLNLLAARRRMFNDAVFEASGHNRTAPAPNLYVEHDIGNKNVRYPDGTIRSVRTRKVRDTGGATFYVFDANTPLQ